MRATSQTHLGRSPRMIKVLMRVTVHRWFPILIRTEHEWTTGFKSQQYTRSETRISEASTRRTWNLLSIWRSFSKGGGDIEFLIKVCLLLALDRQHTLETETYLFSKEGNDMRLNLKHFGVGNVIRYSLPAFELGVQ